VLGGSLAYASAMVLIDRDGLQETLELVRRR